MGVQLTPKAVSHLMLSETAIRISALSTMDDELEGLADQLMDLTNQLAHLIKERGESHGQN